MARYDLSCWWEVKPKSCVSAIALLHVLTVESHEFKVESSSFISNIQ